MNTSRIKSASVRNRWNILRLELGISGRFDRSAYKTSNPAVSQRKAQGIHESTVFSKQRVKSGVSVYQVRSKSYRLEYKVTIANFKCIKLHCEQIPKTLIHRNPPFYVVNQGVRGETSVSPVYGRRMTGTVKKFSDI